MSRGGVMGLPEAGSRIKAQFGVSTNLFTYIREKKINSVAIDGSWLLHLLCKRHAVEIN